jgi:rRNA maturation protein Nop10
MVGKCKLTMEFRVRITVDSGVDIVHPDTLAALPPYLRHIAEDKTKEMTEAYSVLSDISKRRQYDRLLGEHRQQSAPAPAPPPQQAAPQPPSGPYCCICGTTLYSTGWCPTCGEYATPVSAPPPQSPAGKQGNSRYSFKDWAPPVFACLLVIVTFVFIGILLPADSNSPAPSQAKAATPAATTTSNSGGSPYSEFPCDASEKVSPIDHKPCKVVRCHRHRDSAVSVWERGPRIALRVGVSLSRRCKGLYSNPHQSLDCRGQSL